MLSRKRLATCIMALFAILAALIATPFVQGPAVQAATAYGANAGTSSDPTGGGNGYTSSHGYSQASADYVVTTASQLSSALSSSSSGDVIWIPDGTTITLSSNYAKTLKSGVALASSRGKNGARGGKIKTTYRASSFMCPILWLSSNSVVSGLVFEGPGGVASTSGPGNCALRGVRNARRIEVENCEIYDFPEAGIYFYGGGMVWNSDSSSGRHWIHHCNIHNIQKHGLGYGVAEEGNCSYLVEYCVFTECRHHIMAQAGPDSYELRYNVFNNTRYYINGKAYTNTQVDCHGGGTSTSTSAGNNLIIHHNTFSSNGWHANVGIRGIPATQCKVYNNWTKKTTHSGLYTETSTNSAFTLLSGGGGSWGGSSTLSKYRMYVYDNWYGSTGPSGSYTGTGDTSSGGSSSDDTSSGSTSTGDTSTNSSSTSGSTTTITTKPAAPTLVSPARSATVSGSSVTFKWNASTGATKYFLIVSTSSSLSTTQSSSSVRKVWKSLGNVTQYTATGFTGSARTYYWWVWAGNSYGWCSQTQVVNNGGWKLVWSGTTSSSGSTVSTNSQDTTTTQTSITTRPYAPKLASPANGANDSGTSVTFRWNASTGATKYFLIVSTSPSLSTTQSSSSVRKVWKSLGNVTEYTATGFADNGRTYYWWVFSGNSYGWSSQPQVLNNGGWKFVNGY